MEMLTEEKKKLLVKISRDYYVQNLTQNVIAKKYHISRPQISRYLAEARKCGIVEINIRDPFVNEQKLDEQLITNYSLSDVMLVEGQDSKEKEKLIGDAVSRLLERLTSDNDIIGINAGKSLSYVGNNLINPRKKNLSVIPLIGSFGNSDEHWQCNATVRRVAAKLRADYSLLSSPAIVSSHSMKQSLMQEPEIKKVFKQAAKATLLIVGIGQLTSSSTLVEAGLFDEEKIQSLKKMGIVANVCNTFINSAGEAIDIGEYDKIIGLKIDRLRESAIVIGAAMGADKVQAIKAALNGHWIDYLVTDYQTAKEILEG